MHWICMYNKCLVVEVLWIVVALAIQRFAQHWRFWMEGCTPAAAMAAQSRKKIILIIGYSIVLLPGTRY